MMCGRAPPPPGHEACCASPGPSGCFLAVDSCTSCLSLSGQRPSSLPPACKPVVSTGIPPPPPVPLHLRPVPQQVVQLERAPCFCRPPCPPTHPHTCTPYVPHFPRSHDALTPQQVLGIVDDNPAVLSAVPPDYGGTVLLFLGKPETIDAISQQRRQANGESEGAGVGTFAVPCPDWPAVVAAARARLAPLLLPPQLA